MNYEKLYNTLISRARDRVVSGYTERHHVVPRSLGGQDIPENIVSLTAREHFLCHYLLTKMYDGDAKHKMLCAFNAMAIRESQHQKRYVNSRLYEALKIQFIKSMSLSQSGTNNSQFGKIWITDGQKSIRIPATSKIPDGWFKGRVITIPKQRECTYCRNSFVDMIGHRKCCSTECAKISRKTSRKMEITKSIERANHTREAFLKSGYTSAAKFCREQTDYNSHQHMFRDWKLYVDGYAT